MGYTNYWYQSTDIPDDKWKKIKLEYNEYVKPIAGDLIDDCSGEDDITFHGSCETFLFSKKATTEAERRYETQDLTFNFCKTRGAKYDLAVWYLLTFINKLCPEIEIKRDM
jgi:hypothetical protein